MLSLKTESDVLQEVADLLRAHRQVLGWRQGDLARRSGVAVSTLRRFERTGHIGFPALSKLLVSMGLADHFLAAFKRPTDSPKSIEAFLATDQPAGQRLRVRVPNKPA